jgi:hypothetical protein
MVVQGDSCAHDPDLVITYCAHDQQTTLHPINMYNYYVSQLKILKRKKIVQHFKYIKNKSRPQA